MRLLVFVNTLAGNKASHPIIRDYIAKQIGTEDFETFECDIDNIPAELLEESYTEGFLNGMTFEQWRRIQKDGIYVNPLMIGLANDFEFWADYVIDNSEFDQTTIYVDIPYEVFKQTLDEESDIDEKLYEACSLSAKIVADCLKGRNGRTLH